MANPKLLPCDQAAIRAAATVPACAARKHWVLVAAVLGSTMAFVDESVVNVALPKIESDLHTTLAAMQWVVNAYTLCMSALLLIGGAAADQFGRRRVFLIGVTVFAVASLGSGLAPNVQWLIAARTLQGVVATLVYALIAAAVRGWTDRLVLAGLAAGTIGLGAFLLAERRSRTPMMPLELFRLRTFSGINLLTLQLYGALGGAFFFLPFLLIQARGYSATAVGAAYLPFTPVLGVLSRWSGGLVDRFGARGPLIIGPALTALGFLLLSMTHAPFAFVLVSMTVL